VSFALWLALTVAILTAWALLDKALGRPWNRRADRRTMARRIAPRRASRDRRGHS
jgi:hypothetical protein